MIITHKPIITDAPQILMGGTRENHRHGLSLVLHSSVAQLLY